MKKYYILSIFLILLSICSTFAQTSYTSNVVSGDWDVATSWTPVGVPGSADDVLILAGHTISVIDNEQVDDIVINGILDHFGKTLTINGSYEVNGLHQSDENITMNGVGQTIDGTGTIRLIGNKDFQINDNRTILSTANLVINLDAGSEDLIIATATITNQGTVELIGGMKKGGGNGTWVNSTNSFLRVFGQVSNNANFTFTASALGNTVEHSGTSRTLTLPTASTYHNLKINGSGTKTLAGNITVNGDFENKATLDAAGFDIDIKGNWTESGTFTSGTGEVTFTGTSSQSITGAETFYDLDVSTGPGQLSISADIIVQNVLTLNGIILAGTSQITIGTGVGTGSVTYTSGLVDGKIERYTTAAGTQTIDFHVGAPDFDGLGYKLTTLTLISTTISAGGSVLVEFVNSVPGNGGLPLVEVSTYENTFADGYWRVTDKNGFTLTTFDLILKINELEGFTPIGTTDRVLAGTSPNWSFKGTHGMNTGTIVERTGLSIFEDYVLASTNSCTPPSAPTFTLNPTSACINSSDAYTVSQISGFTYYWTVTGGTFDENSSTAYNAFEDNDVTVTWGSVGGNYEVTVLAFDPTCTFSDVSTTSVTLEPLSTSTISGRSVLEENTAGESYSVTDFAGNYSYNWTINGGTQVSGGMTNVITVDWGGQGAASIVVNASTSDCPAVFSPDETKTITLFSTFVTQAAGDLDTPANWVGGSEPGDLDNIRLEHVMTDNGNKRFNHVIISSSGSLATSQPIEVTGVFLLDGTLSVTGNKDLTLNATESFNLEGTGTLTVDELIFSGSDRTLDSLSTLTFNVSNTFDLQVTLENKGSLTLIDLPPSGIGSINTADPDNIIIYGGATQNFALNTDISSYYNLTISGSGAKQVQNDISVLGDFTQSGTATLDASTLMRMVTLSGASEAQTLSGTLDFYNLTVNNTFGTIPQIINSNDITINNILTLTDGVVQSTGVVILPSAATSNAGNAGSYIDGIVRKTGNTDFTFPVGDGSIWASAEITSISNADAIFEAQYFDAAYTDVSTLDPASSPGLNNVSSVEYWDISENSGNNRTAILRLYWEDETRSAITDVTDLSIAKWDVSLTPDAWTNVGTGYTGIDHGDGTGDVISTGSVSFASPITFGSILGNNPLPIELVDFSAQPVGSGVLLNWKTAIEINNDHFEIEASNNGESFNKISHMQGKGNSMELNSYQYLDQMPFQGFNYYRLKQVDYDGTSTYSKTISVFVDPQLVPFAVRVYPNPSSNGRINLIANLKSDTETVHIQVRNISGQIIFHKEIIPGSLLLENELNLDGYEGLFFITIVQGNYIDTTKALLR